MISLTELTEWEKALKGIPHAFTHTWEYCYALFDSFNLPTFLYIGILNNKKVICPFWIRQKEDNYPEIVTPYGFSGFIHNMNDETLTKFFKKEWEKFALNNNFITAFIMQHPCFFINKKVFGSGIEDYNNLFLIDLSVSLENIWNKLRKGHKYILKKLIKDRPCLKIFEKNNLKIIEEIIELYFYTLDRVKASKIYYFKKDTLKKLFGSKSSLAIGVLRNNKIEAVSLFLYSNWIAEYFLNASTIEGRIYSRLLVWEAIKILKKLGIKVLNLGGGVKPGDSLENFKRGFGGKEVKSQIIKQIFCYEKYNYLVNKYLIHNPKREFFPPYWEQW